MSISASHPIITSLLLPSLSPLPPSHLIYLVLFHLSYTSLTHFTIVCPLFVFYGPLEILVYRITFSNHDKLAYIVKLTITSSLSVDCSSKATYYVIDYFSISNRATRRRRGRRRRGWICSSRTKPRWKVNWRRKPGNCSLAKNQRRRRAKSNRSRDPSQRRDDVETDPNSEKRRG